MGGAPGEGGGPAAGGAAAGVAGLRQAGERDSEEELEEVRGRPRRRQGAAAGAPDEVPGARPSRRQGGAAAGARDVPGRRREGRRRAKQPAGLPDNVAAGDV